MCSHCHEPKKKCKVRYIVVLFKQSKTSQVILPLGSAIGIEKTIERLVRNITENKSLDQYQIDLEKISHLNENNNTSEKFDTETGEEWVWFTLFKDHQFKLHFTH